MFSGTLEPVRDLLAAVVEEEAEGDGDVEVDSEDVGLDGRAEADRRLKVGQTLDERAARILGRLTEHEVDEAVEHIGAYPELEGVLRAGGLFGRLRGGVGMRVGMRVRMRVRLRLGLRRARDVGGTDQGEEEEVG
ncbi:hypothetical protein SAY86_027219 [Trapa natans]|uniref:Uncharacterized protein n=1 Tax=Trapa natans TaxID=22666 RepID=A0AAN7QIV3_TRANT|nr:hypothetical protein SAY86_027219 [Trapa natans]